MKKDCCIKWQKMLNEDCENILSRYSATMSCNMLYLYASSNYYDWFLETGSRVPLHKKARPQSAAQPLFKNDARHEQDFLTNVPGGAYCNTGKAGNYSVVQTLGLSAIRNEYTLFAAVAEASPPADSKALSAA